MTRKRKKRTPLGPAWLADMTISLRGWKVSVPLAILSWMWRHWRGVGSVVLAGLLFVWTGEPVLAGMSLFVVYGLAKWKPAKRKARWWDEETLAKALVSAGVLKTNGDALPKVYEGGRMLSRRGRPVHTDHGTTVVVNLPNSETIDDLATRRKRIASALRVPENRLSISQRPDDAANVVRLHVGTAPKSASAPPVATMERTNWRDPVTIGYDSRGGLVQVATFQRNTLVGGRPGYGKTTSGSRPIIAHFLLDPSTVVKIVDGKGSVEDYGACIPLCETYISGNDDDAVPRTLTLLEDVLSEVQRRNRVGGEHAGWLVVLEELQDIRAECGKAQLEWLDKVLGRIIRKGRAVGVVLLILTQKPSAQDIPTGVRSQVAQGLAFHMHESDYAMALGLQQGTKPQVALPRKPGEAIWSSEGEQERVICYHLTDADWRKVCGRATTLRTSARPPLTLAPPPTSPPDAAGEGLVDEVVAILADEPKGLPASQIHRRLSEETREAVGSDRNLGVALTQFPDVVTRVYAGSGRAWRLTEGAEVLG